MKEDARMRRQQDEPSLKVEVVAGAVPDVYRPATEPAAAEARPVDDGLRWTEEGDPRKWVVPRVDVRWPDGWWPPVVLVHYPPRDGGWFWRSLAYPPRCPVGSIMLLTRALTGDEVDQLIDDYGRQHNAYLAFAFDCYQYLMVCVLQGDGEVELRGEIMIPSCDGEWGTYVGPETAAAVDAMVRGILADPEWQALARRPEPPQPLPDLPGTDEAEPPSLEDLFGTLTSGHEQGLVVGTEDDR